MKTTGYAEAAEFLKSHDNYYILMHVAPDGDAVGSGFGLCRVLRQMGKNANVLCSDPFPKRYGYLYDWYEPNRFTPKTVVAVDLADCKLFGKELSAYEEYVDLCIDHHVSNTGYAKQTVLDPGASAACEVLYEIFAAGDMALDGISAKCLYTGIATDTGCFKFENTTPRCHVIVSELMAFDLPYAPINRQLFDIKSRARLTVEQEVLGNAETYLDDKCAIIAVTYKMMSETGLSKEEFEGLASLPMQIEGVVVGVTIKEREEGKFKISMRSTEEADVSAICAKLGGGGHARAAGCSVDGSLEQVKMKALSAIAPALGFDLWLS